MSTIDLVAFVAYPYLCLTIFRSGTPTATSPTATPGTRTRAS
jgi:hypothetical protein